MWLLITKALTAKSYSLWLEFGYTYISWNLPFNPSKLSHINTLLILMLIKIIDLGNDILSDGLLHRHGGSLASTATTHDAAIPDHHQKHCKQSLAVRRIDFSLQFQSQNLNFYFNFSKSFFRRRLRAINQLINSL